MAHLRVRTRTEIVESGDSRDDRRERLRHGGFGARGEVQFASDHVIVQRSVERGFHLRGGTVEGDPSSAAGDFFDGKPLGREPRADEAYVGVSKSETVSELFGRKPAVVIGRAGVVLRGQQPVEFGLLRGGARKTIDMRSSGMVAGNRAAIEIGARARSQRPLQPHGAGIVNGPHDAALLGLLGKSEGREIEGRRRRISDRMQFSGECGIRIQVGQMAGG